MPRFLVRGALMLTAVVACTLASSGDAFGQPIPRDEYIRFVPLEVRDRNSQCTGAAEVPLALAQDMRLDDGTIRRFDLMATYSVVDDGLLVTEQLVTTDRAANSSEENARVFRTSDGSRTLPS